MSTHDYWLCDFCGKKAFYDATLDYTDDGPLRRPDGRPLPNGCGDAQVLCLDCAKTHRVFVLPVDKALDSARALATQPHSFVPYLTIPEIASSWNVSPGTVRRLIKNGSLPAAMIGLRIRVSVADADRYVADHPAPTPQGDTPNGTPHKP